MLNDFDDNGCNAICDNLFSLFYLNEITSSVGERRTNCNTIKLSDFTFQQ